MTDYQVKNKMGLELIYMCKLVGAVLVYWTEGCINNSSVQCIIQDAVVAYIKPKPFYSCLCYQPCASQKSHLRIN